MSAHIVKAKKMFLKSTLAGDDTQLSVREMVDSKNRDIEMSDIGDWGVIVIKSGEQIEMIKFDGLTRYPDKSVTLNIATNGRNIDPTYPYQGYTTGLSFQAGAEAILTNDPLTLSQFVNAANGYIWTEQQVFTHAPHCAETPDENEDLTNKEYVDTQDQALQDDIDTKVTKTGDETIDGVKTFVHSPIFQEPLTVPEGTLSNQALTKNQIEQLATGQAPIVAGFKNATISYDNVGRVATVVDNDNNITYTLGYDSFGRVSTIGDGTNVISVSYDTEGRIISLIQT